LKGQSNLELLFLLLGLVHKVEGRTRLQKMIYLLKERGMLDFTYNFIPYFFGPYSSDLQNDVNLLASLGLINVKKHDFFYTHELSDNGKKMASKIEKGFGADLTRVRNEVNMIASQSTSSLIEESKKHMSSKLRNHSILNLWK